MDGRPAILTKEVGVWILRRMRSFLYKSLPLGEGNTLEIRHQLKALGFPNLPSRLHYFSHQVPLLRLRKGLKSSIVAQASPSRCLFVFPYEIGALQ